jgi:hypothetical protein
MPSFCTHAQRSLDVHMCRYSTGLDMFTSRACYTLKTAVRSAAVEQHSRLFAAPPPPRLQQKQTCCLYKDYCSPWMEVMMLQQHQPALTPHFYVHFDACDKWGCHRSQLHSSSSTARNLYPNYGFTFTKHLLCCAVLCCAVLCCAVLCCAVLCCAVLCCAVLCCAVQHNMGCMHAASLMVQALSRSNTINAVAT